MKTPKRILQATLIFASAFTVAGAFAQPIDFNEVSLLVRARESEKSIVREVAQRKLLLPLTAEQENTLKQQGARESLIQTLRRPGITLAAADASAFQARRDAARQAAHPMAAPRGEANIAASNVHVFNVAFGHPLNLSQWGGLDYEIAFYSYRFAGEDHVEPVMIDNVRTVTEVTRPIRFTSEDEAFASDFFPTNAVRNWRHTPYNERNDVRDNRLALNDTVSVRSNFASRPLAIDWQSPVYIQGQPYAFYPVYGAGDVSLYYIGKANDRAARVAVVSR
ncbi:MAG: hypothetical protein M3032_02465 [Verrucomicrobiota bacterium]|nr:hypothetical protein [Verrucomicrobiota bacterium]